MNTKHWNKIIELWHAGKPIDQISKQTGVPEREVAQGLLGATDRTLNRAPEDNAASRLRSQGELSREGSRMDRVLQR